MKQLKIKDLKPNPQNPRRITPEKIADLKRSYEENGDLGGVVFNVRSQQLIGGHQTARSLDQEAIIHIEKKYKEPTKTGTVAEGYVDLNGERLKYREVDVDSNREKVMNIAANRGAGQWDLPLLTDWLTDLDAHNFDLNLTMFDNDEIARMMAPMMPSALPPAIDSGGSDGELADGQVQRIIMFFKPEEYAAIISQAQDVMGRKGITDLSELFTYLLQKESQA